MLQDARPRWWQWPTVLSLDAPAVSVAWLALLAGSRHAAIGWPRFWILGASVWLAYAADRWIEGWRLSVADIRTQRHRFYQRWRWPMSLAWLSVLIASVALAIARLTRTEIAAGLALTACVIAYLVSHQNLHRHRRWRVPKEICIAGLLTAGVALFLIQTAGLGAVAVPLGLFACLCFVNCVLISSWEREIDRAHGQSSLALHSRHTSLIPWIPWTAALVSLIVAMGSTGLTRSSAECAAVSALLLAVIDRTVAWTGWALAHLLADASLLTPLIVLIWR